MNNLKIINGVTVFVEVIVVFALAVAITLVVLLPNGQYIDLEQPHWEIKSKDLKETLRRHLPTPEPPILLSPETVEMSFPISNRMKWAVGITFLFIAAFLTYFFEVFRKIIRDVEAKTAFSSENIRRVKLIGFLVTIGTVMEWCLELGFVFWVDFTYHFEGLELISKSTFGWPVLLLGLLIIVLGVAFEQGRKMQEENELTV